MEERIGYKIRKLSKLIGRKIENSEAYSTDSELTRTKGWIIGYLYRNASKNIFQKDIEKEFNITSSSTTEILKNMEDNGYIMRISDQSDGRYKKITLTEKGIITQKKVVNTIENIEKTIIQNFSLEELEQFIKTLEKIEYNLTNEGGAK